VKINFSGVSPSKEWQLQQAEAADELKRWPHKKKLLLPSRLSESLQ
jgi:hypothetical protein